MIDSYINSYNNFVNLLEKEEQMEEDILNLREALRLAIEQRNAEANKYIDAMATVASLQRQIQKLNEELSDEKYEADTKERELRAALKRIDDMQFTINMQNICLEKTVDPEEKDDVHKE